MSLHGNARMDPVEPETLLLAHLHGIRHAPLHRRHDDRPLSVRTVPDR